MPATDAHVESDRKEGRLLSPTSSTKSRPGRTSGGEGGEQPAEDIEIQALTAAISSTIEPAPQLGFTDDDDESDEENDENYAAAYSDAALAVSGRKTRPSSTEEDRVLYV